MEIGLFSKQKSSERFEKLAAENEKKVYSLCYHMMGNREDAMDCAQEAMLRAFRAFSSFRREASFSTWICRIASNVCLDELRKRRVSVSLEVLQEEGFEPADPGPGVYAQLEEKDRMTLLREGLAALDGQQRQLIVLRDVQGFSYDEIAQMLALPLGTVKSRMNRARRKLSALLSETSELFSSRSV